MKIIEILTGYSCNSYVSAIFIRFTFSKRMYSIMRNKVVFISFRKYVHFYPKGEIMDIYVIPLKTEA